MEANSHVDDLVVGVTKGTLRCGAIEFPFSVLDLAIS